MGYRDEERAQTEREEKRLQQMSVEELKVELDVRLKAELIEGIRKLDERIDSHLDEAAWSIICATLGVKKDDWHNSKWEIDDHHKGSALAKAMGDHVLAQVKLAIPGFIEGLVVGDPRIPPIKAAYTKSYKEHLAEMVNQKVWEIAHKNADKRFVEIMEEIGGEKVEPVPEDGEDEKEEEDAA